MLYPAPWRSALLGFLRRVPEGARYAVYPCGGYTRACMEDCPAEALSAGGRRLVGFVDDGAAMASATVRVAGATDTWPIAPLSQALVEWDLDAILLTRDTADGALRARLDAARRDGSLGRVLIVDRPTPTIEAALAHLGTYHPTCTYDAGLLATFRGADTPPPPIAPRESVLVCTLDAEAFPHGDADLMALYAPVMRAFCALFAEYGFTFSLCVQRRDTPGVGLRTPDAVVEAALDAFGPAAVELHGLDHTMPVAGYDAAWFEQGLAELQAKYGVQATYWAAPGWNVNWRTLRALERVPRIRAMRGVWTGVNWRQPADVEAFRFPYRVGACWQIPYSYVDWMFVDYWGKPQDWSAIEPMHRRLAEFAARGPCIVESVVHPFRLVGTDWRERLEVVRKTLNTYAQAGVRLVSVTEAMRTMNGGLAAAADRQEAGALQHAV